MLGEIPKASGGDRKSEDFKNSLKENFDIPKEETQNYPVENLGVSKAETIKELGFTQKQVERFIGYEEGREAGRQPCFLLYRPKKNSNAL